MKNITVKYGIDSITKQVEDSFTFGDLQESETFQAALGFGDRTKALVEGIEQDRSTVIPAGATVRPRPTNACRTTGSTSRAMRRYAV